MTNKKCKNKIDKGQKKEGLNLKTRRKKNHLLECKPLTNTLKIKKINKITIKTLV